MNFFFLSKFAFKLDPVWYRKHKHKNLFLLSIKKKITLLLKHIRLLLRKTEKLLFPFSKTSTAEVKNREGFKLFEWEFFLSFMPLLCGFSKEFMAQFF